jgi:hypothetical protein
MIPTSTGAALAWDKHNLQRLLYFRSLTPREKLRVVEGMCDVGCRLSEMRARNQPAEEKPMSDDLQNRSPQDRSRVSVNEEWEIRYWTKELGVTERRLRDAVKAAGTSAEKVRAWLQK